MSWPKLDFSQTSKCRGTSRSRRRVAMLSPWLRLWASSARPAPPRVPPRPASMRSAAAPSRLRWPGLLFWPEVRRALSLETLAEACHRYLKRHIHYLKWKYLAPGNLELAFSNPSFSPCPPLLLSLAVNPSSGPSQKSKELCAGREYTVSVVCPTRTKAPSEPL